MSSLRPGLLHDAGHRDLPAFPGLDELLERVTAPLAAAVEPLVDGGVSVFRWLPGWDSSVPIFLTISLFA